MLPTEDSSVHCHSTQAVSRGIATNPGIPLLVNRLAFLVTIFTFSLPEFLASRSTRVRDSASIIGKCGAQYMPCRKFLEYFLDLKVSVPVCEAVRTFSSTLLT